jgi:hypothetical protein
MIEERIKIGDRQLVPGDRYYCRARDLGLSVTEDLRPVGGVIEDIRGGGFYGKTLLFDGQVIKSTQPDDWHLLWRRLNWGLRPFPPQNEETAARLDFLSTSIISQVVPKVTRGEVITPRAVGYVDMGPIGYGQVLERMKGRGVKFDPELGENEKITKTREQLWALGKHLGFEQAGQVHPDNPFGKQNLWLDEEGRVIWLDTLPAIRHTGFVWPAFHFPFHRDIRESFGGQEVTFNRIHTSRLKGFLASRPRLFSSTERDRLDSHLEVYDDTLRERTREADKSEGKRGLVIESALSRELVTPGQAARLEASDFDYGRFLVEKVSGPAFGAFSEVIQKTGAYRIIGDPSFRADVKRFLSDPGYRRTRILEGTTLKGMREACELGLVTEEEWSEAWDLFEEPLMSETEGRALAKTYAGLQAWYIASGSLMNVLSLSAGTSALFSEKPLARLALASFVEFVLPSLVRAGSTAVVDALGSQDLKTATKVSALPYLGSYLAVTADLAHRHGKRSETIWHYTKRGVIASLSKVLRPWGGWNSDLEANLWEKLKVESW